MVYRTGDKVLQLVNQPEEGVFNGDMGEIVTILFAKENTDHVDKVIISFDGIEVTYTKQDLNQITHAYCCSIHKSQGSEFPIVILPVVRSYYRMLRRNLLYTAITRSKNFLIICGEEEAFRLGVERNDETRRRTTLSEKLREEIGQPQVVQNQSQEQESSDLVYESYFDIFKNADPMIGMEGITPYDFM